MYRTCKLERLFPLSRLIFTLMLALLSFQLSAAQMPELYRVGVPVSSQSGGEERDKAMSRALSEVLVKVTGQRSTLNNAGIKQSLKKASALVQSFGYERRDTDAGQQLLLQVRFDEAAVNRLLRDNGLGIWDSNRPDTIVWLAIEKQGARQILRETVGSPLVNDLKRVMAARSLPLTFPLMDFEDSTTISEVDVWGLFSDKLGQASARYGSEAVLAGRLSEARGRFNGRIVLLFRNQRFDASVTDLSAEGLALAIADLTGNTLSRHYAVLSGGSSVNPVLEVDGITHTRDYAGVVNYLKGLTAVRDVTVIKVSGNKVELELVIDGTLSQLSDAIALGRNLRATGEDDINQTLKYRWLGN
ncbi:DUF2066 domain-containing protein [Endozoicomonas numazuensis]|uniref:DUF2066 domain-containing protein n=1 Tax=Endozoicomonas numazuensis TaxID=1137799 RepID=A0A081NE55_9GAMM|nr:DUF2066 domain-containing protein [Endozoicomonas numazuensis]KEQ16728.1 hypothetical protein GZ78_18720 [Endozoicomonas numazuensis]